MQFAAIFTSDNHCSLDKHSHICTIEVSTMENLHDYKVSQTGYRFHEHRHAAERATVKQFT